LLFGTPVDDTFGAERLAENEYVNSVLAKANLTEEMLAAGYQTAATMVELFADLPPDHEFFQLFGFISAEDLPDYQALMTRVSRERLDELRDEDRKRLMSLPFKLIPARHRLGIVTEELRAKILEARKIFAADLPDNLRDKVAFFDPDRYNAAANLQDNILFGKVAYGQAQAQERVGALIREVVDELGLYDTVVRVGLNYQVGIAGSRLAPAQRQKLAIARAIIKRPDLLILSEATATLDSASQAKIMENILAEFSDSGLIWSLHRASDAAAFDYVIVMKGGRIVERGKFDDIKGDDSALTDLMAAE
jgi:energy-coupling factor transporter ATP-binding protein EcfA2